VWSDTSLLAFRKNILAHSSGLRSKANSTFIHSSMALHPSIGPWSLLQFRNLFYTDGRTPWTRDKPSQGRYLHTGQHKHSINANTDIHALSGIRTHDPSVQACEDSPCLRPRGQRDRQSKQCIPPKCR
jgi:hypothetical protein